MKRILLAPFVAALLLQFTPALADDPPSQGDDEEYGASAATKTTEAEETQAGAASMEPQEDESPADRSERAFVENVWNSP